jgi:serine protease Do
MGSRFLRGARGGAVALIGLSGLLFSCSSGLAHGDRPFGGAAQPAAAHSANAQGQPSAQGGREVQFTDTFEAPELEKQFELVARRVSPAVVAISATDVQVDGDGIQRHDEINPDKLSRVLEPVDRTVGTGFLIDSEGYVVTNEHVVGKAEQIWVTTDDHKVYPALVVGSDPRSDLAVLKIPGHNFPTVRFADGAAVRRGQWTIAIGNPYGMAGGGEMAVSVGVVSAIGRSLPKLSGKEDRLYSDLIQTTAQINPGNSGGPLFDVRGDVIGVNCAVILPQKQTNGIGFALPAGPRLRDIIENLKDGREVTYGYLGVRVSTPTARECRQAGLPTDEGAKIDFVDADSPAEAARLKVGDVIVRLNGESIHDGEHFVRAIGAAPLTGTTAVVYRDRKAVTVNLTLRRREIAAAPITRDSQRLRWNGLLLGPIPPNWRQGASATAAATATAAAANKTQPPAGVLVVAMDPKSPAAKLGIHQGQVITTVAGKPVTDIKTLQQVLNDTPAEQCALGTSETKSAVATVRE